MFGKQALNVFEHRRLLQSAEHLQSQRIPELTSTREYTLIHSTRKQNAGLHLLTRQVAERLDAIHAWHLQIQQDQRRLTFPELLAKSRGRIRCDYIAAYSVADLLNQFEKV